MATIIHALVMFCFLVLMHKGDAYEFVVGGQKGWSVPSDPNANPLNQWAEKSRFQVGDFLGELLSRPFLRACKADCRAGSKIYHS